MYYIGLPWIRQRGSTSSGGTGPAIDHTRQNRFGYYLYIETSGAAANKTARLTSSVVTSSDTRCLTFWYHMYGAHINTLTVRLVKKLWL